MSAENKAVLRRWFEDVWNKKKSETIDQLLAPGAVVSGVGRDMHGPEDFKAFHRAYCDAFPDVRLQIDGLVAEGDMVVARFSGTATHSGGGLGFAATQRPVKIFGITMCRVEKGRIVEGWNSFNQLEMFQQMGVKEMPPAP